MYLTEQIVDYNYNTSKIVEFSRKFGKKIMKIIDFKPYFFVLEQESELAKKFGKVEFGFVSVDNEKIVKLSLDKSGDVPTIRTNFTKTFESKIPLTRRYIIDKIGRIEPYQLKTGYFDIETDDDTFPDIVEADKRILCKTVIVDNKVTTWIWRPDLSVGIEERVFKGKIDYKGIIRTFSSEKDMLNDFITFIQNSELDVLTAYAGNNFDFPYTINRMNRLGLDYKRMSPLNSVYVDKFNNATVKGIILFDLLEGYKKVRYDKADIYTLDAISKEENITNKLNRTDKIRTLWETDLNSLIEYNVIDVISIKEIDEKRNIINHFNTIRCIGCCNLNDAYNVSFVLESMLLNKNSNIKFPTREKVKEDKMVGAFVLEPIVGVHQLIPVYDVDSLYPSIIRTFNIDYTSFSPDGDIIIGDKRFKSTPRGLIPRLLDEIVEERKSAKIKMKEYNKLGDTLNELKYDQLQNALKILANASYGVQAFPGFTLYKKEIAETIPFMGQIVIKHIIKTVEKL